MTQDFKVKKRAPTASVLKVFWSHSYRYRWAVLTLLGALITFNVLLIIVPLFYKRFFDLLASVPEGASVPESVVGELLTTLFIIIGIEAISWILRRVNAFTNIYFESRVMADLVRTSFGYLLGHSYRFFSNSFAGSLVRKVNRLSQSFEHIADQLQFNFIPLIVTVIGSIIVLFYRHALLGAVLLAWLVIFLGFSFGVAHRKQKYDLRRAEKDSEATGVLADALTNAVTIKLFSGYEHEKSLYRDVTDELRKLRVFTWSISEWFDTAQGALMLVIEFVLMYFAISLWQRGVLTVGDFALIQRYLMAIFMQLWGLSRTLRRIYEGLADAAEMVDILQTPHEIQDEHATQPLVVKNGKIEFRDVDFSFHKNRKALARFNLTIRAGEKVALVGPSGAGKTTVTKLLFRFYDIDSGEILIDGQNVACVSQESLWNKIALVPQEPILFHRTLKDNIRYGKRDASDEAVADAAEKARCHEFISGLPEGYETYVGERGVKLSGGERQRVAIARAILKNAPILVLDEATSSLDSESEALIQDALKKLMTGRTTIVIAHRLSTIMQMDRIVVIDEGRVVAEGTHAELLQQDGIYKKLWEIQAGGFIE